MAEATLLDSASRENRRDLVEKAVELYKSGAEPSSDDVVPAHSRAAMRQAQRAAGNRGTKTATKNPVRHVRRLQTGAVKIRRAVLVDEALHVAQDRVEHPIKSRLRRH